MAKKLLKRGKAKTLPQVTENTLGTDKECEILSCPIPEIFGRMMLHWMRVGTGLPADPASYLQDIRSLVEHSQSVSHAPTTAPKARTKKASRSSKRKATALSLPVSKPTEQDVICRPLAAPSSQPVKPTWSNYLDDYTGKDKEQMRSLFPSLSGAGSTSTASGKRSKTPRNRKV